MRTLRICLRWALTRDGSTSGLPDLNGKRPAPVSAGYAWFAVGHEAAVASWSAAAAQEFAQEAHQIRAPKPLRERYQRAVSTEQLRDLERLWYAAGDDNSPFAR